ncbi:MAG: M28 family peptidase [Thermoproteota archaeon]
MKSTGSVFKIPFIVGIIIMLFFLSLILTYFGNKTFAAGSESNFVDAIPDAISNINYSAVENHVRFFSSLNSRVTGYPGSLQAASYIIEKFKEYGLIVDVHKYSMAIPYDEGSYISVVLPSGKETNITAYALWPNGVQTSFSNRGIIGKLVYVGSGSLEELHGKNLTDSIALMDFNSESNWILVANFGAKAVIFIEPSETNYIESLKKTVPVPINVPRLYVNRSVGSFLKELAEKGVTVEVFPKMKWREIEAYNIIGMVRGEKWPNEVIIVSAHYDSWSVVPAISPGAEDSLGVSSMLEMARYFSIHRPQRTIWFIAFSGYWEAITGEADWIEKYVYTTDVLNGTLKILLQIDLDFSTETNSVDLLYTSPPNWQGAQAEFGSLFAPIGSKVQNYVGAISSILYNETNQTTDNLLRQNFLGGQFLWGTQPGFAQPQGFYMLESAQLIQTRLLGFTVRTQWATRERWLTPINDLRFIEWRNFRPQIQMSLAIVFGFVNDPNLGFSYTPPTRFDPSWWWRGLLPSYITLEGKVVEFNISRGWYTPVSGALVRMYYGDPNSYLVWPFLTRSTFSDSNGSFTFYGLRAAFGTSFDAWKFDEETGEITYTVDYGYYGTARGISGGISNTVVPMTNPSNLLIPVFRCSQVSVLEILDPRNLRRAIPWSYIPIGSFSVYERNTKTTPLFYSLYYAPSYGIASAFVQSKTDVVITFIPIPGEDPRPLLIYANSTIANPEGSGYIVEGNTIIRNSAFQASKDMFLIAEKRYKDISSLNVRNLYVEKLLNMTSFYLKEAESAYKALDYEKAYSSSLLGLSLASKTYNEVMSLQLESSYSLLFFTALLLPFSFFFEKLVFSYEGKKRIVSIISVLLFSFLVFYFVHPAFHVMTLAPMSIIGVALFYFELVVILILSGKIKESIEQFSTRILGYHKVTTEKLGVTLHSLFTSVDEMRQRPLTSLSVLLTIIILVAAQSAFLSLSYEITTQRASYPRIPPFNYILVKNGYGIPPDRMGGIFDVKYVQSLYALVGNNFYVSPRVWLYPVATYPNGISIRLISSEGRAYTIAPLVILGLSKEETKVRFNVSSFDQNDVIISDAVASQLKVKLGDKLYLRGVGLNLTVVKIITENSTNFNDIDGYSLLPIDPIVSPELSRGVLVRPNVMPQALSLSNVIIIPWRVALDFGGFISSIALIPKVNVSETVFEEIGNSLPVITRTTVYVGYNNQTYSMNAIFSYVIHGWELVMPTIVVLSALNIISAMVSSVYQRKKEIVIYTSLGLSPLGAILMFLTEALSFAITAIIIGYLFGFALNGLFIYFGLLPKTFSFNFTSVFIIVSLGVTIGSCLIAAMYPAIVASKMIVPSLERKWKFPTQPKGNLWELPLPINVRDKIEAVAFLAYLKEYYEGSGAERPGYVVTEITSFKPELGFLTLKAGLTPLESGTYQEVKIESVFNESYKVFNFFITLRKLSGSYEIWLSRNFDFVDDIRKQSLLWSSLPQDHKKRYFSIIQ